MQFIQSCTHALRGIIESLRRERHMRIHMSMLIIVLIVLIALRVTLRDSAIIVLTAGFVIILEMINAAIELFADTVHPEHHTHIGYVKDMLAGAVLISAVISIFVGIAILLPYIEQISIS